MDIIIETRVLESFFFLHIWLHTEVFQDWEVSRHWANQQFVMYFVVIMHESGIYVVGLSSNFEERRLYFDNEGTALQKKC